MPNSSVFLMPKRSRKTGNSSMNTTSDIWPMVSLPVALVVPISVRNGLAFW